METIELKPQHEKKLSFEELDSLSENERKEIESIKVVYGKLSIDVDDDYNEELDLGHIVVKMKNAIYTTEFDKYNHCRP